MVALYEYNLFACSFPGHGRIPVPDVMPSSFPNATNAPGMPNRSQKMLSLYTRRNHTETVPASFNQPFTPYSSSLLGTPTAPNSIPHVLGLIGLPMNHCHPLLASLVRIAANLKGKLTQDDNTNL